MLKLLAAVALEVLCLLGVPWFKLLTILEDYIRCFLLDELPGLMQGIRPDDLQLRSQILETLSDVNLKSELKVIA